MGMISLRELNANVSKAVARVEGGETLNITKHGKVVAEMRPKARIRDAAWSASVARADAIVAAGFDLGGGPLSEADKYGDALL